MQNQKILITGGTGFIGRRLVDRLADKNCVTVLTRTVKTSTRIAYIQSYEQLSSAPDVVFNLAGAPIFCRWSNANKRRIRDSRISLTQALTTYLNNANPHAHLVSASAVGFYGASETEQTTSLNAAQGTGFAAQLCADWEAAASAFRGTTSICRLGIVLGPGGFLDQIKRPTSLGLGALLGTGRQGLPWIHIDDVVDALILAAETKPPLLLLVAPAKNSSDDVYRAFAAALNRPIWLRVSSSITNLLLGASAKELLNAGQYFSPEELNAQTINYQYTDLSQTLQDIVHSSRLTKNKTNKDNG